MFKRTFFIVAIIFTFIPASAEITLCGFVNMVIGDYCVTLHTRCDDFRVLSRASIAFPNGYTCTVHESYFNNIFQFPDGSVQLVVDDGPILE